MAEAFLNQVAKSLGSSLTSYAKDEVLLGWRLDSEVKKLERTVDAINAVLRDAEKRPGNGHGGAPSEFEQDWLAKLRDAVYDADDVFDEIVTRAQQKKLMEGNAFTKEVKLFFSSSNQLSTSISLAERVQSIREDLDQIYGDRQKFGNISYVSQTIEKVVHWEIGNLSDNLVGRDYEKDEIVSMLLDPSFSDSVCVIPIVGVGGLGKSSLARHVFNQVKSKFDLAMWVALPQDITLQGLLEKVVACGSGEKPSSYSLEDTKLSINRLIDGKKYILVLDNIWNENIAEWRDLELMLSLGAACGSRILLTTRSVSIANNTATVKPYELQPLSDDNSWSLFENIVFGKKGCRDAHLKEIGFEILSMCNNVPLAVRALAGVVATNISVSSWSSFRNDTLSNLASHGKCFDIMPVLEASYDALYPSALKSCFSYCSLFPRGFEFDKTRLISLWIAQTLIEPAHRGLSLEEEGAGYLETLLNRGLLQNVPESHSAYKLHDLMHDLACSVAEGHCRLLSSSEDDKVQSNLHHVSIGYRLDSPEMLQTSLQALQGIHRIRTFLLTVPSFGVCMSRRLCENLMASFHCLRVLGLRHLGIKELPESIGTLIHLRYLELYGNHFTRLPNSITLLSNLQYLDLMGCFSLTELPKNMKKLVNMRHLLLDHHPYMVTVNHFPHKLGNLTKLQTLSLFIAGWVDKSKGVFTGSRNEHTHNKSNSKYGRLSDLKTLNDLRGDLSIQIRESCQTLASDAREANLKGKTNLTGLSLNWKDGFDRDDENTEYDEYEMVLENLEPPNQISQLFLGNYKGRKLPTWMGTDRLSCCLVQLTSLTIDNCTNINHIPSLSQLPRLMSIWLRRLPGVEYIESSADESQASSSPSSSSPAIFFPSLTKIDIEKMYNLKGWNKFGAENLSFPCVSEVLLSECPELECLPCFPNVKTLTIVGIRNPQLLIGDGTSAPSSVQMLESIETDSEDHLVSLPKSSLARVTQLTLNFLRPQPLDVSKLGKGLEGMTSLESLRFLYFRLESFTALPAQLCSLHKLVFYICDNEFPSEGDGPWRELKSLCFLKLDFMIRLESLPRGIRLLTTLQSLVLDNCPQLREIPDWIGNLGSLSRLELRDCNELRSLPQEMTKLTELKLLAVHDCPNLQHRCQRDTGEDWHKIQHVKQISIR